MKSTFEKIGGTYTLGVDGIYYPNLVSTDKEPHYGKYGIMRKTYLKEHRPAMYSLYIAQIKKKCGLDVGENFNPAKSENARHPQCTLEKEDAIMQAFRHFCLCLFYP